MRQPKASKPLSHFIRCEAHGDYATGKTKFGATFPGPRYWHDPTHGCDYFQTFHLEACPYRATSHVEPCQGPPCLGDYVENTLDAEEYFDGLAWAIDAAYKGIVKTIILDDQSVMKDGLISRVQEDMDAKVSLDNWGPIKRPLNRVLTKIAAAPVHLLVTARASEIEPEQNSEGKIKGVRKAGNPKVWDDFLFPMDFVLYFTKAGTELAADKYRYVAQIQKSRIQDLPSLAQGRRVEDPSFEGLFRELLEREKGLPPPEYSDPDKIGKRGPAAAKLEAEAKFVGTLHAIETATDMTGLTVAWTMAAKGIKAGDFDEAGQKALKTAKDAMKVKLEAGNVLSPNS